MSYDSEVLADSPWGYWKTNETSGSSLADSSGNSRTMTINGSPTLAQTGPNGTANAVSWTSASSQYAITSATTNAGALTLEAWVYLTATPAATVSIMARSTGIFTAGASDGELYIDTAGKVRFMVYDGADRFLTPATTLSLNTWHHVVGSVGAGGMKIRVDKTTIASSGTVTAYTGAGQYIFMRAGGSRMFPSTTPILISRGAYYTSQLSDARTDAHYDAGFASPDATVTAPAATATAAGIAPVVSASFTATPPAATATAAGVAPAVTGTGDATVLAPAATSTAAGMAPSVTAEVSVIAPPATATAQGLVPTVSATSNATVAAPAATATAAAIAPFVSDGTGNQTVLAPAATATAAAVPPTIALDTTSDTSNALSGRTRGGRSTVEILAPVVTPTTPLATRVEKSIALPMPDLVNGRPT